MSEAVIIVGDVSTHTNVCLSGSPKTKIGTIPIAHVNSAVSGDPHKHGPNIIAGPGSSGKTKFSNGDAVACNGAPTACGASMSASVVRTRIG
jgi:uncharacterized Zn-binding protein involved in type VI secretion